jgi:hypothetical protein
VESLNRKEGGLKNLTSQLKQAAKDELKRTTAIAKED